MTSLLALALLQAALAGGAAVLAALLGDQRRNLPGQRVLALWSALAALSLAGGAVVVVSSGTLHWAGLVAREVGISSTIVLMVFGTGALVGRRPPVWLLAVLVGDALLRLVLLLSTDLLFVAPAAGGLSRTGSLYIPTAAITFPLVSWWLAVTWSDWADRIERNVFILGLVGMMPVGLLATVGRGLAREIALALVTVPLLAAFLVVLRHRRRQREAQIAALRTQQEELGRALETSNGQLHRALAVRDDLLDVVTHELRTPLTPIRGFLELLATGEQRLDAKETPAVVALMLRNAIRLNELIDEALLARQLRRGRLELPAGPEQVEIGPLVDRILERLDVGRLTGQAEVVVSIPEDLMVTVAPSDAEQILHQVLDNAFRHGRTPVAVRAESVGAFVEVEVHDQGDGIPAAFRTELFDLFSQASKGERREVGGLGLGLGVARRLAEANGGQLHEAERAGSGACFVISLPLAPQPGPPPGPAPAPSLVTPAPRPSAPRP